MTNAKNSTDDESDPIEQGFDLKQGDIVWIEVDPDGEDEI
jgi:hypothetical protein